MNSTVALLSAFYCAMAKSKNTIGFRIPVVILSLYVQQCDPEKVNSEYLDTRVFKRVSTGLHVISILLLCEGLGDNLLLPFSLLLIIDQIISLVCASRSRFQRIRLVSLDFPYEFIHVNLVESDYMP